MKTFFDSFLLLIIKVILVNLLFYVLQSLLGNNIQQEKEREKLKWVNTLKILQIVFRDKRKFIVESLKSVLEPILIS
jgi:hypothetical protein